MRVKGIDRLERNRSRFIGEAVEHELARRRRDGLLSSVRNPHPDTVELADAGIEDWTADLPDEDGLVDATAGTAVRWVEGQGWAKEPARRIRRLFGRVHSELAGIDQGLELFLGLRATP